MSQNQGQTPLTTPSGSNISGLALTSTIKSSNLLMPLMETTPIFIDPLLKYEYLHMRTAVPVGTVLRLQETPNPVTKLDHFIYIDYSFIYLFT